MQSSLTALDAVVPGGACMTAELTSYSGKGAGTSRFNLRKLVPTMTMRVKSDYAMKVGSYGEMKGVMDMTMSVSSR